MKKKTIIFISIFVPSIVLLCILLTAFFVQKLSYSKNTTYVVDISASSTKGAEKESMHTADNTIKGQSVIYSSVNSHFYISQITDEIFARIDGKSFNEKVPVTREELRYIGVLYIGTDDCEHEGEIIVNEKIAEDTMNAFLELYQNGCVIESMRLVDDFGASDVASMSVNNTSGFNARYMGNSESISQHAYGMAIDINPLYNPYVYGDEVLPASARMYIDRKFESDMKITADSKYVEIMSRYGFVWGGEWAILKDYMHFEQ